MCLFVLQSALIIFHGRTCLCAKVVVLYVWVELVGEGVFSMFEVWFGVLCVPSGERGGSRYICQVKVSLRVSDIAGGWWW